MICLGRAPVWGNGGQRPRTAAVCSKVSQWCWDGTCVVLSRLWLLYVHVHAFLQFLFHFRAWTLRDSESTWLLNSRILQSRNFEGMSPVTQSIGASMAGRFQAETSNSLHSCTESVHCSFRSWWVLYNQASPQDCFGRILWVNHSLGFPWPLHPGFLDGNKLHT